MQTSLHDCGAHSSKDEGWGIDEWLPEKELENPGTDSEDEDNEEPYDY